MSATRQPLQLTTVVAAAVLGGVMTISARAAATSAARCTDAAQDWKLAILDILAAIGRFLDCRTSQTDDVATRINEIQVCYHSKGISLPVSPSEGRALIEQTYILVLADPGDLTIFERTSFLLDLTQMYMELGGNPLDLGK